MQINVSQWSNIFIIILLIHGFYGFFMDFHQFLRIIIWVACYQRILSKKSYAIRVNLWTNYPLSKNASFCSFPSKKGRFTLIKAVFYIFTNVRGCPLPSPLPRVWIKYVPCGRFDTSNETRFKPPSNSRFSEATVLPDTSIKSNC